MSVELLDYVEVRKRIHACPDPFVRACLATIYLCCARVSEIVAKPRPNEKVYALATNDIDEIYFAHNGFNEPVILITVRTAKRNGLPRKCPIPANYDPLVKYVLFHKKLIKSGAMFPIDRKVLYYAVKKLGVFEGLKYRISPYIDEGKKVKEHEKDAALHFLRHVRANELYSYYNLNPEHLAAFGGWRLGSLQGGVPNTILTPVMERYVHLNFRVYMDLLFKEAPYIPPPPSSKKIC